MLDDLPLANLLTLIAAVTGAVVAIINAIANGWGRKEVRAAAVAVRSELVTQAKVVKTELVAQSNSVRKELADRGDRGEKKLDEIHQLTDGNLSKVQKQLAAALARIENLETLLQQKDHRS
jgi:hypothetical protein